MSPQQIVNSREAGLLHPDLYSLSNDILWILLVPEGTRIQRLQVAPMLSYTSPLRTYCHLQSSMNPSPWWTPIRYIVDDYERSFQSEVVLRWLGDIYAPSRPYAIDAHIPLSTNGR
jgi:hypothetical protein